jgi:glycosyltransferase involved in cell wall biosynthesis
VATTDHGPLVGRIEAARIDVVDVDMMRSRFDPRPVVRLRRLMKNGGFDLIHFHGTRAGFFGVLAASALPRKPRTIYTVHGLSCNRRAARPVKRFFEGVERFIASRVDRVISVSENDRQFGVEHRIFPSARTSSIPNGIEVNGLAPGRTPFGSEEIRVVTVARLVPQKGLPILLEAARRVRESHPQVHFTVLGEGPDRAALEARARQMGVADGVSFLGTVADVAVKLLDYDLFVLPSLWEGMPISLLEAMVAGRPVIATEVSGSAELILEGETGRLVPPGDANALAGAILELVADPQEAVAMAARGRDRVRRDFSIDRMVASNVAVYRELL